ncbi:uncharacterized protein LOC5502428 [Nematostella vectensis]|uniref:uncharacterized protein LOC5502428 n=1 Tax=Nematostella vectensis TaxID=45351 RepID=UPI002077837B|nr:uncharacterized protein LOC5502428 [Nematostella vectensis]
MVIRSTRTGNAVYILAVFAVFCVFAPVEGESLVDLLRVPRSGPPLAKNQNPICRKAKMLHSDVLKNASLQGQLSAGNFTYLGDVKDMEECMGMCCAQKGCQLAYLDKMKCYGVKCYSQELCKVTSGIGKSDIKISLMVRNDINRRAYVTAYIVVVVVAFGAAVSGTVWAVFIFVKRYKHNEVSPKSSKEDEDEDEGKEAKVY